MDETTPTSFQVSLSEILEVSRSILCLSSVSCLRFEQAAAYFLVLDHTGPLVTTFWRKIAARALTTTHV